MTDTQLFLSIGIPSLLIVLSWINNNSRFNGLDKRIDAVERRLDGHDKRFVEIDIRFNEMKDDYIKRFDEQNHRFDELKSSSHKDALEILRAMTALHERVAVVEARQNA